MNTSSDPSNKKNKRTTNISTTLNRIQLLAQQTKKYGVFTSSHLLAAGFKYTGDGDTARCKNCGLEVSNWTLDMNPFNIHSKRQSTCSFVHSMKPPTNSVTSIPALDEKNKNVVSTKVEVPNLSSSRRLLVEVPQLQQARTRTFSHWSPRIFQSSASMIAAGFFSCSRGDRVICLYCNIICQYWTVEDDPHKVHCTLSPHCIYVKSYIMPLSHSYFIYPNETVKRPVMNSVSSNSTNISQFAFSSLVALNSAHPSYSEIPKRHASYATWPTEALPSVDDLVRAGFFYTGTKARVTCFYCNGSLQNWGPNDNPMIEHARWFPHCAYARQLCGDELYRKIQKSKRAQQERARINEMKERVGTSDVANTNIVTNSRQLLIPDENTLSELVTTRLDLPSSRRLLDQNFKLSIIKRCWEDQLRLKHDDFVSEYDLYVACLILQKQIEHIDGKKEKIIIPSIKMEQIEEQDRMRNGEQIFIVSNPVQSIPNTRDFGIATSCTSLKNTPTLKLSKQKTNVGDNNQSTAPNLCVLCLTEERRLGCIPCGHMTACDACGHSLKSCPICRRKIEAFVRVYI